MSAVGDVKADLTPKQLLLDGGQRCQAPTVITLAARIMLRRRQSRVSAGCGSRFFKLAAEALQSAPRLSPSESKAATSLHRAEGAAHLARRVRVRRKASRVRSVRSAPSRPAADIFGPELRAADASVASVMMTCVEALRDH